MILKPIQIVLDSNGNQIDLNYKPIRSHTNYKHIIQIVAGNLPTEACDVTVSTYGKEIISETVRTRLAVDADGNYLKGSDVVSSEESYYTVVQNYNVWEVELVGTVASILQKINTSKISIVVSFSIPVVDARALVNVGTFGSTGDLPTITTETIGDYRVCDLLAYTSTLISTEFKYRDIAIYNGSTWIKGSVFRMIQTCPMIQLSVDPSLALMYQDIEADLAEILIDDVARVDGIVSDVQTKVNTLLADNININNDVTALEAKDVLHEGRLDALETTDTLHDGRLDSLEDNDIVLDNKINNIEDSLVSRIEDLESEDIVLDNRLDVLETEDASQKIRLTSIELDNVSQANRLTAIETPSVIKSKYESNANTNAYTDAEKSKLASLENSKFLGTYINLSALQSAHPSPVIGSYAHVDSGVGAEVVVYIWDDSDNQYLLQIGEGTTETAASIKSKYESNEDTNAYTDAEKSKLASIEDGAEVNDANTTLQGNTFNGNSQLVQTTADGKLPAIDGSNLTNLPSGGVSVHNDLTGIQGGDTDDYQHLTTAEVSKLTGIEAGAEVNDANTTLQGNTFNGNSQLVQTTADGKLPAIDGSNLIGLPSGVDTHNNLAGIQGGATGDYQHITTAEKSSYDTAVGWGDHSTEGYLTSETNTSLTLVANTLTYTDETGTPTNIDLSLYLDDTNLARIISGVYNSELQTLVFTRDDASTFSIDASMFLDDTNLVTSINGEVGIVVLDTDDIDEGSTNLYYTEARVAANSAVVANTAKISADVNATNQGNTFNGNSQLVQTTADGKLPVLDGSNLTNLPAGTETDPVFTAWDKSTGISITESQISDFGSYVTDVSTEYTGTIPTTSWTGASAPYTKAVTVLGITATDKPIIDLDLSSSDYADVASIETAWSKVYRAVTSTDTITFYASEVPTIAIPITIKVVY